jgi:hypothetical protein
VPDDPLPTTAGLADREDGATSQASGPQVEEPCLELQRSELHILSASTCEEAREALEPGGRLREERVRIADLIAEWAANELVRDADSGCDGHVDKIRRESQLRADSTGLKVLPRSGTARRLCIV